MDDLDMASVLVTDRAVLFNGVELPCLIAQDGISFKPGGWSDVNRLTVEFLVGPVVFTDPSIESTVVGDRIDDSERRWNWILFWILSEWQMENLRVDDLVREYI